MIKLKSVSLSGKVDVQHFKSVFRELYTDEPLLVRSPGRINIIGEHTDYNCGFVMPAAINKAIYIGISKRNDEAIHLYAEDYKQHHTTKLSELKVSEKGWPNYIIGIVNQLLKRGYCIGGFNLYVDGDIPLGAGLSSSAAVECAAAYALDQLFSLSIPRFDIPLIAQEAEHIFAGVSCGIMDQFASVFGKKDHAILLDCRSMDYQYIPLRLKGYHLLLLNTNVKHALSDSAYNKRRTQCEQGVAWVKKDYPEVTSLRDVNLDMLDQCVEVKDKNVYKKCRFVVTENQRLIKASTHLQEGNLEALGQLMLQTHWGLSRDYEVSCKELDFLVNAVKDIDAVLGARMMGGGFGGCTLNIVKSEEIDNLINLVSNEYLSEFGIELDAYVVETDSGTSQII